MKELFEWAASHAAKLPLGVPYSLIRYAASGKGNLPEVEAQLDSKWTSFLAVALSMVGAMSVATLACMYATIDLGFRYRLLLDILDNEGPAYLARPSMGVLAGLLAPIGVSWWISRTVEGWTGKLPLMKWIWGAIFILGGLSVALNFVVTDLVIDGAARLTAFLPYSRLLDDIVSFLVITACLAASLWVYVFAIEPNVMNLVGVQRRNEHRRHIRWCLVGAWISIAFATLFMNKTLASVQGSPNRVNEKPHAVSVFLTGMACSATDNDAACIVSVVPGPQQDLTIAGAWHALPNNLKNGHASLGDWSPFAKDDGMVPVVRIAPHAGFDVELRTSRQTACQLADTRDDDGAATGWHFEANARINGRDGQMRRIARLYFVNFADVRQDLRGLCSSHSPA